jgi:ectoine hydroxylase-related dioxygenase (phytanoyl-CoA dioxygenase family)
MHKDSEHSLSPSSGRTAPQLHARGFCVIPNVVPAARLARVSAEYDRGFATATAPDLRTSSSGGDTRLSDLVNRGPAFDDLYVLEPVLAACLAIIGSQFKLSSFHGRTVLPGAAAQRLHVDVRPDQDAWPLLGFIVMLDEFRSDNGATRFVPGSHHGETPINVREGNHRPDDESPVLACGEAGSVIVYLGSTWHGYSANRSQSPRRSIQGAYIPRDGGAAAQWVSRMTPKTLGRLSPSARYLLALD